MDGGAPVPTPGDVARRLARLSGKVPQIMRPTPPSPPRIVVDPRKLAAELADEAKDLEWIVDQLGMTSLADALQTQFIEGEPSPLATLLAVGTTAAEVIALWKKHLHSRELTVLGMLAFERWFSAHPAALAAGLRGGMQFDKTLHVCRQHVGIALYEHARELNWRRPFVCSRALSLAREYLQRIVEEDYLTNEHTRGQFLGKAAVATVLISRFENCEEQRLRDALGLLDESMNLGNPVSDAMPYYLEGATRLYDLTGDVTVLLDARRKHDETNASEPRPAQCLSLAELWLRLAEVAVSDEVRVICLRHVRDSIEKALDSNGLEPADRVRYTILVAFTELLEDAAPQWHPKVVIRTMRTPFGLAEHALNTLLLADTNDACGGLSVVDHLIAALTKLMTSSRGEPLCRRVLADLQSAVSASSVVPVHRRISALREATRIRQGYNSPLTDEGSRIRQGDDLIHLAALTNNPRIRREGIVRLLNEAVSDPNSCNPLVILGRDVETNGAIAESELANVERGLERESGYRLWLRAVARGDETELYRSAAARAIRSPDVRHRHLGGRSNALTVEDHLGLSTDTFVFKRTSFRSSGFERHRAEVIGTALTRAGLADRYGLVDHITVLEESLPDGAGDLRTVMTVRRFARGSSLADVGSEPAVALARLTSAARYLAFIHAIERETAGSPSGMRKELKTKEIGRWLKVVVDVSSDRSYFERWWELAGAVPSFPRRDAHAFNWIVTDDERILAVDLEAMGWRPVGYELAQLTDDVPVLPYTADGWTQRLSVMTAYGQVLAQRGAEVGSDLLKGYIAGLIARAVRALTDPGGSRSLRLHGQRLLELIANEPSVTYGRDLACDILTLWARRLGAPAGLTVPDLADSRRRHISKALAFHLRHNPAITRNPAGWVPVELLTGQLRADGLRVSTVDVLAVAAAIDETRFENSDTHIRATYGHSVPVDIDYEPPGVQPQLFHATPIRAANAIFQSQGGGLRPMTRQWVHLSTNWKNALKVGGRKGSPVLLSVALARGPGITFHHAGGATWLAGPIPAEMLTIIPLYEIFEWMLTNQ